MIIFFTVQSSCGTCEKKWFHSIFSEDMKGFEIVGDYRVHKRFYVATELGYRDHTRQEDFFDFSAKYEGKSQEITPARITERQQKNAESMAKKIYNLLKMKGYTRSEFIFQGDIPYLLEVNTTPGLTEESILPQQAQVAGFTLSELFESAINEALK